MFVLSRNVLSLKHLKDIFYIILAWPKEYSEKLKFQISIKNRERERKNCYSYLTFVEVLILFSENDEDKIYAENSLFGWFLNQEKCRNNKDLKDDAIRICNLFLNNELISPIIKKEINLYLNQTKEFK